jgi:hypothetical protein
MGEAAELTPSSATTRASARSHVAHVSPVRLSVPHARGRRAPGTVRRRGRRGADHEAHALELVEHHHALGPRRHPDRRARLAHPHLGAEHHHHLGPNALEHPHPLGPPRLRRPSASPSTTRHPRAAAARGEPGRARGCPGRAPPPRPRPAPSWSSRPLHHLALGEIAPLHHLALVVLEVVASLGEDAHAPTRPRVRPRPARTIPSRAGPSRSREVPATAYATAAACPLPRIIDGAARPPLGPAHDGDPRAPAARSIASWGRGGPLGGVSRWTARARRARRGTPRPRA